MSHNRHDDELRTILKQKQKVKISKQVREKSLQSFQEGLNQLDKGRSLTRKKNHKKRRSQLIGGIATLTAAGIAGLLIANTNFLEDEVVPANPTDYEEEIRGGETVQIQQNEEEDALLEEIFDRPTFDYDDLNGMRTNNIYNDTFSVYLPSGWSIEESHVEDEHFIQVTGNEGQTMNLSLFDESVTEEVLEERKQEALAAFAHLNQVDVPPDRLIEHMRMNFTISFPYKEVFPFSMESTEMFAFFDEDEGKFIEIYVSELFGQSMIYTAQYPLHTKESWTASWLFFTYLGTVGESYTYGEGERHPDYERPTEKKALLRIGAFGYEEIHLELFEIEELRITSYIPTDISVEQMEHDYFTEWRFFNPEVSEKSFYSFGKLKEGFPLDRGKEIMFETFGIDPSYHEDLGGGTPHHYAYYSGMDDAFIDGSIELFEQSGEWYYKHKHADREDYNGGVFMQRLQLFIDSLEWH
ncbi:hypothetical protein JCM9140_896 [Halalkalibacter wakoensis JCM 9140]|uniref:Uncharacterized protein n=1 Tax=Halalkalibacter wakoensis JCM 9140 TaxID=1236970 RepID=W4PZ48_9BACI|nr:hypothetical protein [Halalkalibacter wakoensis]GAE24930.1 hypothetical protein JCM9140_896 [Halalkalibacter wakoensis JCM 9140]